MTTVAVFGASGRTGHRVVERLVNHGQEVIAISRRPGDVGGSAGMRTAAADLTRSSVEDLRGLLSGVDAVVFAAAGDPIRVDSDGAMRVIAAAQLASVKRFVLITGMGAGRVRPAAFSGGFWDTYFGAKEESERALQSSSLEWTILQPGELLNGAGEGRITLAPTGTLPIGAVAREDLAALIAAIVDRPAASGHRWEVVSGRLGIEQAIDTALSQ